MEAFWTVVRDINHGCYFLIFFMALIRRNRRLLTLEDLCTFLVATSAPVIFLIGWVSTSFDDTYTAFSRLGGWIVDRVREPVA